MRLYGLFTQSLNGNCTENGTILDILHNIMWKFSHTATCAHISLWNFLYNLSSVYWNHYSFLWLLCLIMCYFHYLLYGVSQVLYLCDCYFLLVLKKIKVGSIVTEVNRTS